jgi:hypothetical protein
MFVSVEEHSEKWKQFTEGMTYPLQAFVECDN